MTTLNEVLNEANNFELHRGRIIPVNRLKSGIKLLMKLDGRYDPVEIIHFTDMKSRYGEKPEQIFHSQGELLKHAGVSTLPGLETQQDNSAKEYGYHYYLVIKDLKSKDKFRAYLSKGKWVVGSNANPIKFYQYVE